MQATIVILLVLAAIYYFIPKKSKNKCGGCKMSDGCPAQKH